METALTTQLELPNLFPETPPRGVGRGCGLGLAPRNPAPCPQMLQPCTTRKAYARPEILHPSAGQPPQWLAKVRVPYNKRPGER